MARHGGTTRRLLVVCTALLAGLGIACGDSSDGRTGVFIDSVVGGLRYVGPNFSGRTNAAGEYRYEEGDEVCFFIDDIPLGCTLGNGVVTPVDLFEDASSDSTEVINVVRLLLSLDADGDPSNGIDVGDIETTPEQADDFDFSQDTTSFGMDPDVTGLVTAQGHDGSLADPETAEQHFEDSLDDDDVLASLLLGDWTYTSYYFGIKEVSEVDVDAALLEEIEAESDESTITFYVLDGEGPEVCEHYAYEVDALAVLGYYSCYDPMQQPNGQEEEEEFAFFRMDKIVSGTDYETDDLLGDWLFIDDFDEMPMFSIPLEGEEISLDANILEEVSAQVSGSGIVTFTTVEESEVSQQGIVPQQTCNHTGRMNVTKDWVAGTRTCSLTEGERNWAMQRQEMDLILAE